MNLHESRMDASGRTMFRPITGSLYTDCPANACEGGDIACVACGADGTVRHVACEGKGCDACAMEGDVRCRDCNGKGETPCPHCNGIGKIPLVETPGRPAAVGRTLDLVHGVWQDLVVDLDDSGARTPVRPAGRDPLMLGWHLHQAATLDPDHADVAQAVYEHIRRGKWECAVELVHARQQAAATALREANAALFADLARTK